MKKNIYINYSYNLSLEERIKLIKNTGFDGIFVFGDDEAVDAIKLAKEYGLNVETIHLPFKDICNSIWLDNDLSEDYINEVLRWIDIASLYGIDKVIFHLSQTVNPPAYNELGFNRIRRILKYCEEKNVFLCLENLRFINYLDETLKRIESPKMKMCFDIGHANCFSHNIYNFGFEKYAPYIICMHIHDNNGISDEHLIPFEGNIKYNELIKELKQIGYNHELSLEVFCTNDLPDDKFLRKAKESLDKIEDMFKNE